MSTKLLCTSCRIEVDGEDGLRTHYKSDYHRYNIKRGLVQLPPVSLEVYKEKRARNFRSIAPLINILSQRPSRKKKRSKKPSVARLASK